MFPYVSIINNEAINNESKKARELTQSFGKCYIGLVSPAYCGWRGHDNLTIMTQATKTYQSGTNVSSLMLGTGWIPRVYGNNAAIDVQLPHH